MFRSASLLTLFFSPSYCILRAKSGLWAEVVSLCGSCCREFKEFSNSQIQLYCTRCRHARQPPPSASPLVRWQYTKAGVCLHAVLGTACVFFVYLGCEYEEYRLISCECVFVFRVCACSLAASWERLMRILQRRLVSKNTNSAIVLVRTAKR